MQSATEVVTASADLVAVVMSTLTLGDASASRVCTLWAAVWRHHLPRVCKVDPRTLSRHRPLVGGTAVLVEPLAVLALADGTIVVACDATENQGSSLQFFSKHWDWLSTMRYQEPAGSEWGQTPFFYRAYGMTQCPIDLPLPSSSSLSVCLSRVAVLFVVDCVRVQAVAADPAQGQFAIVASGEVQHNVCTLAREVRRGSVLVGNGSVGMIDSMITHDMIHILDAHTLEVASSFGQGKWRSVNELCLLDDDSLVVAGGFGASGSGIPTVCIYSACWTGISLRSFVCGAIPESLCVVDEFLMSVESVDRDDDLNSSCCLRVVRTADGSNFQRLEFAGDVVDICAVPPGAPDHALLANFAGEIISFAFIT